MENEKSEIQTQNRTQLIGPFIVLFVIFIILLFIIITPNNRQFAPRLICGTNMNGLGKAMLIYVYDSNGYPTPEKWCDLLIEKCEVQAKIFHCPEAKEGSCNYALNKNLADLGTTSDPDIVVLFETHPGWSQVGGLEILTTENHDGDGCNVVFLNGRVEFIKAEDIRKLKWKPD